MDVMRNEAQSGQKVVLVGEDGEITLLRFSKGTETGGTFAAHNSAFDSRMLACELKRLQIPFPAALRHACTYKAARKIISQRIVRGFFKLGGAFPLLCFSLFCFIKFLTKKMCTS